MRMRLNMFMICDINLCNAMLMISATSMFFTICHDNSQIIMIISRWTTAHEDSGGGDADVDLHLIMRLSHQQVDTSRHKCDVVEDMLVKAT